MFNFSSFEQTLDSITDDVLAKEKPATITVAELKSMVNRVVLATAQEMLSWVDLYEGETAIYLPTHNAPITSQIGFLVSEAWVRKDETTRAKLPLEANLAEALGFDTVYLAGKIGDKQITLHLWNGGKEIRKGEIVAGKTIRWA